jgi:hypothetical protein
VNNKQQKNFACRDRSIGAANIPVPVAQIPLRTRAADLPWFAAAGENRGHA